MLAEASTPASTACCAAGELAFAISAQNLAEQYQVMVAELNQAEAVLFAEAEANSGLWNTAEQQIQGLAGLQSAAQVATLATNIVIQNAELTEAEWDAAEAAMVNGIAEAELAIQSAEDVLAAEQAAFTEVACGGAEAEAEAEATEAEATEAETTEA